MHLDWGAVPAWVGALLTGSSLILALRIMLQDRRKGERAEALKVICWSGTAEVREMTTHVLNTADRPVTNVSLVPDVGMREEPESHMVAHVIYPGEEELGRTPIYTHAVLCFT